MKRAVTAYKKALELNPKDEETKAHLEEALSKLMGEQESECPECPDRDRR